MKRNAPEWAVWLLSGVLLAALLLSVACRTVWARRLSIEATEAKPLVGEAMYTPEGLVNVNTATAGLLASVDGVSDTLAGRIVAYREENGPFHSLNDLYQVNGFTEEVMEKAARLIAVG